MWTYTTVRCCRLRRGGVPSGGCGQVPLSLPPKLEGVARGEVDRSLLAPKEQHRILSGRGLVLVTTYADDYGVDILATRQVMWIRLLSSYLGPPQPMPMPMQRGRL